MTRDPSMWYLAQTTPDGILDFVEKGGILAVLIGLLFVIVVGGFRIWYVFGWRYRELKDENKELKDENRLLTERLFGFLGPLDRQARAIETVVDRTPLTVKAIADELEMRMKAGGAT